MNGNSAERTQQQIATQQSIVTGENTGEQQPVIDPNAQSA
jgi:hypothetical protein